jgi:PAS domain S-box-containing protein
MSPKKRISFKKLTQFWGVIFLIGISTSIVAVDIFNSYRFFNHRADQMRTDYISNQEIIIKQEVNRVVNLISHEKAQCDQMTKDQIKTRVYEAYAIAQNIYHKNKAIRSVPEIVELIKDALSPIRFQQGSGQYFITRADGMEVLFAEKPERGGVNLLGLQDKKEKHVIGDMIELAGRLGEGFYEYYCSKPGKEGEKFKILSFVKRFEPYDWLIGTELYIADTENQIKANLLSHISRIRFGKEGYIFVNRFNGDALVSNGQLYSGEKKLWEEFDQKAEKTKAIFNKEYNTAIKPDGDYIYYSWNKLSNSEKESPKVSYIYGIPDLEWIVGAGVYLDDVETDIALMKESFYSRLKSQSLNLFLMALGIIAIFLMLFHWFSRSVGEDIKQFFSFFDRASRTNKKIDREKIKYTELNQIAISANKMLASRIASEEALRINEEKYRSLFENISDIYYQTDDKGKYTLLSPSVERITGYRPDELIGKNDKLLYVYPKEREKLLSRLHKAKHVDHFEVQLKCKDNRVIWTSTNAEIIVDKKGNFCGVRGMTRDVSEHKRMEDEKENVMSQLQQSQKMEAIGTLAGGIAHDFNNVLFSIMGYTELTMEDVPKDSLAKKNLEEVMNGAIRASEMIKQILAFSRSTVTEKKPIKIQSVVSEALNLLRTSIPSTIEIRKDINPNCRPVLADSTQIHQVIMNLCTNAYHAMQESGGVLDLMLMEEKIITNESKGDLPPGSYLKLVVSDTGHGIKNEILEKIFNPYFTTKGLGKGTGMGLSVVHGIIKDHGGDICVSSPTGEGAKFEVYLPLIETQEAESKTAISKPLPIGTEHILLVDDEAAIATMATQMLERLGYRVTARTSSVEALALFKIKPDEYDLVITDMTMPNMTGVQLSPRLKEIRPDIPIIICTGFSEIMDEDKAKSAGILAYIMKPFHKDEIARTIRRILDGAKG